MKRLSILACVVLVLYACSTDDHENQVVTNHISNKDKGNRYNYNNAQKSINTHNPLDQYGQLYQSVMHISLYTKL